MNVFHASWFYWAVGIAVGLPVGLILLTELHHTLVRRSSRLARQVSLLRNYLLPSVRCCCFWSRPRRSRPETPWCAS